jgi:hypothetical protein
MANTTCAKCGGQNFEVNAIVPAGQHFRHNVVQCAACGTAIGVLDPLDTAKHIEELKAQLKTALAGIEELKHRIVRIEHAVSREL